MDRGPTVDENSVDRVGCDEECNEPASMHTPAAEAILRHGATSSDITIRVAAGAVVECRQKLSHRSDRDGEFAARPCFRACAM